MWLKPGIIASILDVIAQGAPFTMDTNFQGVGSSSLEGTTDDPSQNFNGLLKAAAANPGAIYFDGIGGGTADDVTGDENPLNAKHAKSIAGRIAAGTTYNGYTVQQGHWLLSYAGNGLTSANLTSEFNEMLTGMGYIGTQDFYLMHKFSYLQPSKDLLQFVRKNEQNWPAQVIDWDYLMSIAPEVDPNDPIDQSLGIPPRSYALGGFQQVHMNASGYLYMHQQAMLPLAMAHSGGVPFIPPGRAVFSRAVTCQTNGGFVADVAVTHSLAGCSISTTSTDFALSIQADKTIRITRASSTVLKNDYTVVPVRITKAGVYQDSHFRVACGNVSTTPGRITLRGQTMETVTNLSGVSGQKFSCAFGIQLPSSLDGRQMYISLYGASTANFNVMIRRETTGAVSLYICMNGDWTKKIISGAQTPAVVNGAAGFVWVFMDVDLTRPYCGMMVDDDTHVVRTTISSGSATLGPITTNYTLDTLALDGPYRFGGGDWGSTAHGLLSGPVKVDGSNVDTSDKTIFPVDLVGPFLFNDDMGFTDSTVGVARRAAVRDATTKAPVAWPSDYKLLNRAGDTYVQPYIGMGGYASDLWRGSTDTTQGLTARNLFGTGPDMRLLYYNRMSGT